MTDRTTRGTGRPEAPVTTWRRPEILLFLMAATMALNFAVWQALINNFAIERAAFTGREIGILQSIREIPGFLAFLVVYLILLVREQRLAILSLLLLSVGIAVTGFFPTVIGLYLTTLIMSIGFHYYATLQTSLTLQWIVKDKTPELMGRLISVDSFVAILAFGLIWFADDLLAMDYLWIYLLAGSAGLLLTLVASGLFPRFDGKTEQHKKIILRQRYWLFYALTFLSGARRQIFVVFAGFLMVEKFGYDVGEISLLFLVNAAINVYIAPKFGRLVARIGERNVLVLEYLGLIVVFTAYAFVENATLAAGLYIIDHLFFALAIAISTYFQKIADPPDIAATAGVSFTINHIAAIIIPAAFGFLWLQSPAAVFLAGAAMAACSLLLALNVPRHPEPGYEVVIGHRGAPALSGGE